MKALIRWNAPDLLPLAAFGFVLVGVPAWLLVDRPARPVERLPHVAGRTVDPAPAPAEALGRVLFASAMIASNPAPGEAVLPVEPDGPELVGIVGRLSDDAVALVRARDGRSSPIAIGEEAGGWRLAALGVDAALFVKGGERRRVYLPPAPISN